MSFLDPYRSEIQSIVRIALALVILQYGLSKHLGLPESGFTGVPLASLPGIAGAIELVGGALLLVGLFTRATAFVLSGLMAAAYVVGHAAQGFFPMLNGGSLAVALSFAFLQIAVAGGGAWSLDRRLDGTRGVARA
ncbi:MAG: DoxX family protein [Paracoccaceae bacterium]